MSADRQCCRCGQPGHRSHACRWPAQAGFVTGQALRWLIYAAIAGIAVTLVVGAVRAYNASVRLDERQKVEGEVAARAAREAEANAKETARRLARQKEAEDAFVQDRDRAAADAARARDAAHRLRDHVDQLEHLARGVACRDPAAAGERPPAGDPAGMLADLQRRADERAGLLAEYADAARRAGQLCERAYEALTSGR